MTYDFATRIKRIEAELMALKIATGSGQGATVYDSEITLTQGGETKGSFTLNQANAETIELDAGGGSEPNDGTLTIQKNGTTLETFSADQSTNVTANITVPTTVAELSDASNYVKGSDLATVATTGSYSNLTNKPTIGNATLTIQKNGTNVQTFTANSTSNKTANITVPTTVAELSDASDYVKDSDLATVATTGSYSSLTGKPTIGSGTLTVTMDGTTAGTFSANATSNSTIALTSSSSVAGSRIYYATCSTSAIDDAKIATTTDGDFTLETGATVVVKFANGSTIAPTTLNVDSTGSKSMLNRGASIPRLFYSAGATLTFVYDGTNYQLVNGEIATAGAEGSTEVNYGVTRLSNLVTLDSDSYAATSSAVKTAYDLAAAKSVVSYSPTLTSGTVVGALTINGVASTLYAPTPQTVSYSQTLSSGVEIGEITIDGTALKLYAPATTGSSIYYATCPTAASTVAKVATTVDGDFVLETGATVTVYFTNYNSAASPTLNVDNTGAIDIRYINGSAVPKYYWRALEAQTFTYNGTYWIADGGIANTTYYGKTKLSSSVSSTSTSLAATPSAVKTAYDLADSKSAVSFTQGLSSGSVVGELDIDGTTTTLYAPSSSGGSTVSYTPTVSSGTALGDLEIDGATSTIYAPTIPTLADVATSGDYSDLSNTPTIGNATLTIQKNGTTVQTFTANSTTAKTANITVPTTVAELSDASDYVKDSDLATVATSGSYSDLSNKPTIGNATLTIQKNGTNVQTFTANSTSSKTANITVPTTVAELSDSSDYVKDSDLATVATSGSYEDLTDKPSDNLVFHGTCSTATGTLAKVATLDDATGFALAEGVMVSITFANSNLAKDATLNVNSTGATYIVDRSLANDYIRDGAAIWQSGETVLFVYSSSGEWERVSGAPTYLESGGAWNFSVGNVLIQSGQVNGSSSATGDISVTFNTAYESTPHIFLTNQFSESGASLWWAFIKSASTTGFTLRSGYTSVTGTGGGGNSSSVVQWLAIGRIAGAV